MAKIQVGEVVRVKTKVLFSDNFENTDLPIIRVEDDLYFVEGIEEPFYQGGDDWQTSNQWRDRFYLTPLRQSYTTFTRK